MKNTALKEKTTNKSTKDIPFMNGVGQKKIAFNTAIQRGMTGKVYMKYSGLTEQGVQGFHVGVVPFNRLKIYAN